ncbi:MAG: aminodeoxychorismate/anthranilate synthase component II [Pseudomonadota bacterium]
MILIIDNYDSFTYNLYQLLAPITSDIEVYRNDKITLDEISALAPKAIILSPGPGYPENAGICIDLIKKFAGHIPLLGVCLGHQAIAAAFGGKIMHAKEIVHGKTSNIFHNRNTLYQDMRLPFVAARYHSLVVDKESLPESLQINAENDEGLIMGINHQHYPVFGVQFHPESILSKDGNKLLHNFIQRCQ